MRLIRIVDIMGDYGNGRFVLRGLNNTVRFGNPSYTQEIELPDLGDHRDTDERIFAHGPPVADDIGAYVDPKSKHEFAGRQFYQVTYFRLNSAPELTARTSPTNL